MPPGVRGPAAARGRLLVPACPPDPRGARCCRCLRRGRPHPSTACPGPRGRVALAGEGDVPVARPATAIGAFIAGAAVAGVVLKWLAVRRRPWFPAGLVCEAVLLVCAGVLALAEHGTGAVPAEDDNEVVALVAPAMGVRASTALRVHVPSMPTLLSRTAIAELINDVLRRPRAALRG
ncbi:DUF1275 family protein [Streptomyces sp. NPDC024017]|uniref:DUF1275 family protein n=1 Tax=Streptomyces sp. NPDC024017 TaxID=3154326 RepID=UPI0033C26497